MSEVLLGHAVSRSSRLLLSRHIFLNEHGVDCLAHGFIERRGSAHVLVRATAIVSSSTHEVALAASTVPKCVHASSLGHDAHLFAVKVLILLLAWLVS